MRSAQSRRWYRDHGDGSDLLGTRREQNTLFDRRDKLLSHRRHRNLMARRNCDQQLSVRGQSLHVYNIEYELHRIHDVQNSYGTIYLYMLQLYVCHGGHP